MEVQITGNHLVYLLFALVSLSITVAGWALKQVYNEIVLGNGEGLVEETTGGAIYEMKDSLDNIEQKVGDNTDFLETQSEAIRIISTEFENETNGSVDLPDKLAP